MSTWQHWMVGQVDASIAAGAIVAFTLAMRHRLSPSVRSILLLIALVRLVLPPWMRSPWSEALVDLPAIDDTRFAAAEVMRSQIVLWMFAIWSSVAMVLLARIAWQAATVRRAWFARTSPCPRSRIPGWCHAEVRVSPAGDGPMAIGIRQPLIVLPSAILDLDADALDAVLAHELAHHERRDLVWILAAQVLCALAWFNPLAHVIARALRATREDGSDDWAVAKTSRDSYAYARALLQSARLVSAPHPAAAMGAHPMSTRLRRLLDGSSRRDTRVGWGGVGLVLVVAGLAIPGAHMPDPVDGRERIVIVVKQ